MMADPADRTRRHDETTTTTTDDDNGEMEITNGVATNLSGKVAPTRPDYLLRVETTDFLRCDKVPQ